MKDPFRNRNGTNTDRNVEPQRAGKPTSRKDRALVLGGRLLRPKVGLPLVGKIDGKLRDDGFYRGRRSIHERPNACLIEWTNGDGRARQCTRGGTCR